jgi:23S rRNA (guanosine2251-2'-O)-methyltransferase
MEKRDYGKVAPRRESADMVFGIRAVEEVLRSGKEIERLFFATGHQNINEIKQLASQRHVKFQFVPEEKLNGYTRKNHQGVVCFISPISYAKLGNVVMQCFEQGKDPLILILDRITDVRNFGAIARTAECAGVDAIVIPNKGSALITADAVKTSAGALNYIPVCREDHLKNTLQFLKDSGLRIVACTEKTDKNLYQSDLKGPLALVMGSEEDGISSDLIQMSDGSMAIPMTGSIASLNVSVAAAVVIFEAIRQRNL